MTCIVSPLKLASFILRSAVGATNLPSTKTQVADLQDSLFNDILSFSFFRPKGGSVTFPFRILIHF